MREIFWATILAIAAAIGCDILLHGRIRAVIIRVWKIVTTMMEIVIYARGESAQKDLFRNVLASAKKGDEILFVGRTLSGIFGDAKDAAAMVKALKHGVALKLLFLDYNALSGGRIDLRSLRLPDARGLLARDLSITQDKLSAVRDDCVKGNFPGSLLVYRTDVLVESSILMHVRSGVPKRFNLDFSFGEGEPNKFTQYYHPLRRSEFCSRLHKFYAAKFDADVSSFDFGLSYRPFEDNLRTELGRLARERWTGFITAHSESEAIRDNALVNIMPAAAQVFSAFHHNKEAPPPVSVQIELTNICSTACRHCFRWQPTEIPKMEAGVARRLLDQLSDFGVRTISLSGGEPTQHPQFIELLAYAVQKQLAVGVLSNGVGLSEQVLEAIHNNAQWLRLSMDGSNSAVYGEVRHPRYKGQDPFRELMITLARFKDLDRQSQRCKLAICYTIQRKNAENVPDMIRMVRKFGLRGGDKCLTFKFAHGRNGFLCTEDQLRKLQALFSDREFEHAANLDYLRWFLERQSNLQDVVQGRPTENLYLRQDTRCFTPHLFALIDPQGDVYPCCFLFEDNKNYTPELLQKRRSHCLGNIGDREFREIWRGADYRRVRDELRIIDPSKGEENGENKKYNKYEACGECTRHCNHNRWLTKLFEEYHALQAAGGNSDAVMQELSIGSQTDQVWL